MNPRRLFLIALLALHGIATASSPVTPDVFNIKTYASPSGRFQFEVDPTGRYGGGPGDCKLTKNGRVLWKARLPFTFYDALVADDGTVAGYGYTEGISGMNSFYAEKPAVVSKVSRKDKDGIRVAIFGPDGKQRLHQKFARVGNWLGYGKTDPYVTGMSWHEDRFTVVIGQSGLCRSYRMSDGKPLGVTNPPKPVVAGEGDAGCYLLGAAAVAGTPLTLLHWCVEDRKQTSVDLGAIFTLIDPTGAQVWELIALGDYKNPDKDTEDRIVAVVRNEGAIFKTGKAGQFELWLARRGHRVRFSVVRKDQQWRVEEVGRDQHELPPPPDKTTVPIKVPEPEKLGTFTLDAPLPSGPVRDVSAFGFDARGRIGFLRGRGHFVLIEQTGALLAEVPLKLPQELPANAKIFLAWIAGDRWLATASAWEKDAKARAWWIDAGKLTMTEIAGFDCPRIDSMAGAGDGGFVVLASTPMNYTSNLVVAFDSAAKRRWSMEANQEFTPERFFSPDSVTVTSRGEVGVLDQARQTVHFYDLGGKHLHTVEIEKKWKTEHTSARDVTMDADGGFIVRKLIGEPPFVRMKADGMVRAEFAPKFKDGGIPDKHGEIRVASDGSMWLSNRHNFLRLTDDGMVDMTAGTKPDADTLGNIAAAACDAQGRIYVADDQTGAVHVFDADGRKLHVCKPTKSDISGNLVGANLAVTDLGRTYLRGDWNNKQFVVFGPDGSRERVVPAQEDYNEWQSRRGTGGMLVRRFEEILLTDEKLEVKRNIDRWPDRRWFNYSESAAVTRDGSFVVLGGSGFEKGILGFYSPNGDPQRTARVPVEWNTESLTLAGWNGKHLVFSDRGNSVICDREGKPVRVQRVPAEDGKWAQFIARDGRELWVLEFETRKVTRYTMPAEK